MIYKRFTINLVFILLLAGAAFAAVPTVIYPWGDGTWFDPIMTTDNHNGSWVAVNEPFTHYIRMFHVNSAGAVQCSLSYHGTTEIEPQHIETDSVGGFFLLYRETIYVFVDPDLFAVDRIHVRHYSAIGGFLWQTMAVDTHDVAAILQTSVTMLDTTLLVCWHWARSDSNGLYCQRINTQSGNLIGDGMWLGSDPNYGFGVSVYEAGYFVTCNTLRCLLTVSGIATYTISEYIGGYTQSFGNSAFVIAGNSLHTALVERYENLQRMAVDSLFQITLPLEVNLIRQQQGIRASWSYNGQLYTKQWISSSGWDSTKLICEGTSSLDLRTVATDSGASFTWINWVQPIEVYTQQISNAGNIRWLPCGISIGLQSLTSDYDALCSGGAYGIASWIQPDFGLNILFLDSLSDTPVGDKPGLNPSTFRISIFPNPFNQETTIALEIPWSEQPVDLQIYNTLGQRVLATELVPEGGKARYHFKGNSLTSGIYFVKATANHHIEVKKLLLLK